MDITFITMHDMSREARVLYASTSIVDVLGYEPAEVTGRSCFEYFHPNEIPFARSVHDRGVHLDRAAVLSYCSLRRRDDSFVRCECVFTVVYSVIVACTSLYRHTDKSIARAHIAPNVRRAFANSPRDPRYNMLRHLSSKFTTPHLGLHEPRVAMILNRFTRTLSIMYSTAALSEVLDIPTDSITGKSFYECIQEDCLQDAVDALERAKENDSIAYLRFRWRDPRLPQRSHRQRSAQGSARSQGIDERLSSILSDRAMGQDDDGDSSSGNDPMDGDGSSRRSSSTPQSSVHSSGADRDLGVEVEAVISCTSDGLVVILRKARTPTPNTRPIFASPWALPQEQAATVPAASGPAAGDFMEAISHCAVFAWSLRSINEDIMMHAQPGPLPEGQDKVGKYKEQAVKEQAPKGRQSDAPGRRRYELIFEDESSGESAPISPEREETPGGVSLDPHQWQQHQERK